MSRYAALALNPDVPPVLDGPLGYMPAHLLSKMLAEVLYARSTDETRYNLNGVYVEAEHHTLTLVATDGHQLKRVIRTDASIEFPVNGWKGILMPHDLEVLRRQGKSKAVKGRWTITNDPTAPDQLLFSMGNLAVEVDIGDGIFPDYKHVIPRVQLFTVQFNREALLALVESIWAFKKANSETPEYIFPLVCTLTREGISVEAFSPMLNSCPALSCVGIFGGYRGEATEHCFAMNARYLHNALAHMTSETVFLGGTDNLSPYCFAPSSAADTTRASTGDVCVVMPMRI